MSWTDEEFDLYYQKTYGITLAGYNARFQNQGGVCAICGHPPKTKKLHVDHSHRFVKLKIKLEKVGGLFQAFIPALGITLPPGIKSIARGFAQAFLKRKSVRGLTCHRCNQGLRFFSDDPARMRRGADYLDEFANQFPGRDHAIKL